MPLPTPQLQHRDLWNRQVIEHRRALFERVLAEFPDVAKARRNDVAVWRARLRAAATAVSR